jgi:hypothetical protein
MFAVGEDVQDVGGTVGSAELGGAEELGGADVGSAELGGADEELGGDVGGVVGSVGDVGGVDVGGVDVGGVDVGGALEGGGVVGTLAVGVGVTRGCVVLLDVGAVTRWLAVVLFAVVGVEAVVDGPADTDASVVGPDVVPLACDPNPLVCCGVAGRDWAWPFGLAIAGWPLLGLAAHAVSAVPATARHAPPRVSTNRRLRGLGVAMIGPKGEFGPSSARMRSGRWRPGRGAGTSDADPTESEAWDDHTQ